MINVLEQHLIQKKDNGLSACWLRKGRGELENGLYSDFAYRKDSGIPIQPGQLCDRKVIAQRKRFYWRMGYES